MTFYSGMTNNNAFVLSLNSVKEPEYNMSNAKHYKLSAIPFDLPGLYAAFPVILKSVV